MNVVKDILAVLGVGAGAFILWFVGFCGYAIWRVYTRGDE
jgi:hypothetical protein